MKKDTFYIREHGVFPQRFAQVTGYVVPNDFGVELSVDKRDKGDWRVTERRSGMCIGWSYSRDAVIREAFQAINEIGVEKFKWMIQDAVDRYGLSPLYKQEDEEKEGGNENEGAHDEPAYDEVSEFF